MTVDLSVFGRIKSFQDMQREAQAAQNTLQTQDVDIATKQNALKAQALSAATATGNQAVYDAARQHLAANGIDMSDTPNDIASGTQYANALRLATSPIGSLLNGAAQIGQLTGQIPPSIAPMLNAGAKPAANAGPAASAAQPAAPTPTDGIQPPIAPPGSIQVTDLPPGTPAGSTDFRTAMTTPNANGGTIPADSTAPVPPGQVIDLNSLLASKVNGAPAGAPAAPTSTTPAPQPPPAFQPPAYDPLKTKAANDTAYQQAMDAYKIRPDVQAYNERVKAFAGKSGTDAATAESDAAKATELDKRLQPNFQALMGVNDQLPTNSYGIPASIKEWASSANPFGDHEWATAGGLWKTINEQQTLTALGQLVASGQIKSNRQIVQMIQNGHFVPEDLPVEARAALINAMSSEAHNIATSAGNVSARLNGGEVKPYDAISTTPNGPVPKPTPQGGPQPGQTMQGTDGTYMFNGGDPANPNSWKKVVQ